MQTDLYRRLRACLDDQAFPYERRVCLWAFHLQLVFILVPALTWWMWTAWLPIWCSSVLAGDSVTEWGWSRPAAVVGWAWRLYGAWGAGWLGGFIWADFGPEERYRELLVGCSVNSNLFATNTLEDYVGAKRGRYADDDWVMATFHREKWTVHLPWEKTAQPRYDIISPADMTWAIRLHYRVVRPWLVRRGVPGYTVVDASRT